MVTIMEQKAPCALPVCHHVGGIESNPPTYLWEGRQYVGGIAACMQTALKSILGYLAIYPRILCEVTLL